MNVLRAFVLSGSLALLAWSATAVQGQEKRPPDKGSDTETVAEEIARLIKQLGSDVFDKRDAASKELAPNGFIAQFH
jgi:hypothetical protein